MGRVGIGKVGGFGVRGWIRGVGVELGSKELKSGGLEWGRRGWSWIRRGSSQGVGVKDIRGVGGLGSKELGSEEFGSRGRIEIGEVGGVGVWVGVRG